MLHQLGVITPHSCKTIGMGDMRKSYKILVGKLGRPKHEWEVNIKKGT
jgi:hypothetical protein